MSAVDVLAVMGDDRYAVPARIKDVIDSLKFDEKMRGHNPDRSTVDFPYAISILEAQAAKIAEARAAVAELMDQRTELIARLTQVLPYLYVLENEGIDTAVPVRMKIEQVEAALARCVK